MSVSGSEAPSRVEAAIFQGVLGSKRRFLGCFIPKQPYLMTPWDSGTEAKTHLREGSGASFVFLFCCPARKTSLGKEGNGEETCVTDTVLGITSASNILFDATGNTPNISTYRFLRYRIVLVPQESIPIPIILGILLMGSYGFQPLGLGGALEGSK